MAFGQIGQATAQALGLNPNELTEGVIYDRVQHAASISAGTEYTYFRDIEDKDKADTNMQVSKKLPSGWKMAVWKVGIAIANGADLADAKNILDNGYFGFERDNRTILEGPVFCFPSGYGLSGAASTTNTSTTVSLQANGLPAPGLISPLSVPIVLDGDNTFEAKIKYYDAVTLTAATYVYVLLWGWIQKPIR